VTMITIKFIREDVGFQSFDDRRASPQQVPPGVVDAESTCVIRIPAQSDLCSRVALAGAHRSH
jgi:hypothetical protein